MLKEFILLRALMMFTFLLLNTGHAREMQEITKVLREGEPIKFGDYFCKRENLMRDLIRLFEFTGESNALKIIQGESGRDACRENIYVKDDNRSIRGAFVRSFAEPVVARRKRTWAENHWIIEVMVGGKHYFTYLTDSQVNLLKQAKGTDASAATQ